MTSALGKCLINAAVTGQVPYWYGGSPAAMDKLAVSDRSNSGLTDECFRKNIPRVNAV